MLETLSLCVKLCHMTDNQQPSLRTCVKCGETKPFEDFAIVYAKNSRGQNYRQHTCKECAKCEHAARMRKARKENPEKYIKHQREHRKRHLERCRRQRKESGQRLKDRVFEAYGGYRCVCCGETMESMMTIDHIEENGADHRNEINGGKGRTIGADIYRWLERNNYPAGFQVLCYNCNISKHRNNGICEHRSKEGSEAIRKE